MRLTLLYVLLFACILSACAGKKNKDKSSKKLKLSSMEKTLNELTERIESIERAIAASAHGCMMSCLNGECVESDGSWKCACDEGYTGIHCESEIPEQFHDCFDIQSKGLGSTNGVYEVTLPESGETELVYCDMETDGGGWTVFQRRISNEVDFYRNMAGYKTGFGDNSGNVWLGLNALAQMTANNNSEMQISMAAADDTKMRVSYDYFQVGSAPEYALFVAGEEKDPEYDEISQWVKDVPKFSSQYNTNTWAANTVIGPPDAYPNYGDQHGTWAQNLGTGYTGQYIEIIFEETVIVTAIDIYETYHAGAVNKITSIVSSSESEVLFETEDIQNIGSARIFSPPLKPTTKPTNRIRIEVDNSVSNSWTEIDAVSLHGTRLTQTATAGLLDSVGSSFSTFDDDKSGNDCATLYHGGWWYNSACTKMNLNGAYETPGTESTQGGGLGGMIFEPFQQKKSLKETKMMFRRK